MKEKKLFGMIGVLLSLTILSFMIPVDSPTGYASKIHELFSDSIGEYEIDLDFMVRKEFEFNQYEKIDEEIKRITDNCLDEVDRRSCINRLLEQSNELNMKIGPQNISKAELTKFVEQLYWCKESTDLNCYCNITFNQSSKLGKVYDGIKIKNQNDIMYFSSINHDFEVEMPYNKSFKNLLKDISDGGKTTFENKNNIYFKKDSNNILEKVVDVQGIQECNINQEIFMFSIPSPLTKKHLFYDKKKDEYVFEKPDIEFAVLLKDITPPKKVNFKVNELAFSDKKIVIETDASQEKDVIDYVLFYSTRNFKNDDVREILEGRITDVEYVKLLTHNSLIKDYPDYLTISPDCIEKLKDPNIKYCDMKSTLYDKNGNEVFLDLKEKTTYNFSGQNKFISLLNLIDEKTYYITVLPIDASNNILDFNEADNMINIEVKDRLHPSIFFEIDPKIERDQNNNIIFEFNNIKIKNLDDSESIDVKEYWLYYKNDPRKPDTIILSTHDILPQKIDSSKIKEIISYGKAEPYCYFVLSTDLNRPDTLKEYNNILNEDEYYKNLQVQYNCI